MIVLKVLGGVFGGASVGFIIGLVVGIVTGAGEGTETFALNGAKIGILCGSAWAITPVGNSSTPHRFDSPGPDTDTDQ